MQKFILSLIGLFFLFSSQIFPTVTESSNSAIKLLTFSSERVTGNGTYEWIGGNCFNYSYIDMSLDNASSASITYYDAITGKPNRFSTLTAGMPLGTKNTDKLKITILNPTSNPITLSGFIKIYNLNVGNTFSDIIVNNIYATKLGIGTVTPTYPLNVIGTANISSGLIVDTNTLFVNSTLNRVGIGKTNPAYLLDVVGTANATNSLVTNRIGIGKTNPSVALDVVGAGSFSTTLGVGSNLNVTGTANATNALFTSRVGIGKTNPSVSLDVVGTVSTNVLECTTLNIKTIVTTETIIPTSTIIIKINSLNYKIPALLVP